jgi:hypothetical protein
MSISDVIARGKGRAGAWRVEREQVDGKTVCRLWHYGTNMLTWNLEDPSDPDVLDYSTGWGSVSDQGGMNRAFRVLGLPLYFQRAGGAEIVDSRARRLEDLGRKMGESAGSWVVDGNTTAEQARAILRGLRDVDPVVMDLMPSPLSGEYAGNPVSNDVLAEVDANEDDPAAAELLDAFEVGYQRGWEAEVSRSCRALL